MDHLPPIFGRGSLPPKVACFCDPNDFDGMGFDSFPSRKGFTLVRQQGDPKVLLNADGSKLDPRAFAETVQAWLFFGLLIEVLKAGSISVRIEDFVHRDGDKKYVTTKVLPVYLAAWEQQGRLLSEKDRRGQFRAQQKMILMAMQFRLQNISGQWWEDAPVHWVDRPEESYEMPLPLPLQMSIAILCETLDRASRKVGGAEPSVIEPMLQNNTLTDRIISYGWCPSEISFVLQGLNDTSTFFAGCLKRLRQERDHSGCSTNKCRAFNIVTEQYKAKHTQDCLDCHDIGIDGHILASCLQRGQIPRASLRLTTSSCTAPIELTIRETGAYLAISHVWSDGLGNPKANSLPACQLLRLWNMAASFTNAFADDIPALWIDSLLVPVKKGYEKGLALSRMCDYYRGAERVLVLDSDLMGVSKACVALKRN